MVAVFVVVVVVAFLVAVVVFVLLVIKAVVIGRHIGTSGTNRGLWVEIISHRIIIVRFGVRDAVVLGHADVGTSFVWVAGCLDDRKLSHGFKWLEKT